MIQKYPNKDGSNFDGNRTRFFRYQFRAPDLILTVVGPIKKFGNYANKGMKSSVRHIDATYS